MFRNIEIVYYLYYFNKLAFEHKKYFNPTITCYSGSKQFQNPE